MLVITDIRTKKTRIVCISRRPIDAIKFFSKSKKIASKAFLSILLWCQCVREKFSVVLVLYWLNHLCQTIQVQSTPPDLLLRV